MECPVCRADTPVGEVRCQQCGTPLEGVTTTAPPEAWSVPAPARPAKKDAETLTDLRVGSALGERYQILGLLGQGGMGAVYKAFDLDLSRTLAVKLIRPELARRADILERFKQELILARQITHRNVIRIYDLGQVDGVKFITMEYVEGENVRAILRRLGRYTPEQAVDLLHQVCQALEAAHAEGVIHRDLKPQNIMIDNHGRALVMDFGVARSTEVSGSTFVGELVGTPQYMSPEQARGGAVDTRSDLFAIGIISYELFTGVKIFRGQTVAETLAKRFQEKPPPPVEVDPAVPQALSDIVMKCLEVDPAQRYQTATEILHDLDLWRNPPRPQRILGLAPRAWAWATAGLAVVLAGSVWLGVLERPQTAQRRTVTVLVADFENTTSEPVFNGTLEPAFALAMEGASFISSFPRDQALKTAAQVQKGSTALDEKIARLVAAREGIHVVVTGSITRNDGRYTVSVRAVDSAGGKQIEASQTSAASKDQVLGVIGRLAAPIRKALGDRTPESVQLAAAETFTAASVEAFQAYAQAQELQFAARWDDAIRSYMHALQLDPRLGRAYAGLAVVYRNKRQLQEAEKYFLIAMRHIDRMTERERYRTRCGYFVTAGNAAKGVEDCGILVKAYPADKAGNGNLALAYFLQRNMPAALDVGRRGLEIYPKNVLQRNNVALYAMYAGDFAGAEREAKAVLEMEPSYVMAYVAQAIALHARGNSPEALATWGKLEKVSGPGASMAAAGQSDMALYDGRLADAIAILEKGIGSDLAAKNEAVAANKMATLAEALLLSGKKAAAIAAARRAAATSTAYTVSTLAARVLLQAGQEQQARALAAGLSKSLLPDPQAYGKLIDGELLLVRGSAKEAVAKFQEAQTVADTWLGRFLLARAYLATGSYKEALTELEMCRKRKGEASALFLDDRPTLHLLPPVYYYLGLAQEHIQPGSGAESYRTFVSIKKGGEDPLLADARRLLGQP